MDRKNFLSNFDPTNTTFDEDIRSIINYLASQADKSEWSLDNRRDISPRIISFIRRNPVRSALEKWVYRETQSIQEAFFGLDYPSLDIGSSIKKEGTVGTVFKFKKSIGAPQILKASLSKREIILQSLRPLSGRKTVLDKLRSGQAKVKTDIGSEKHQLLGKKYGR